VSPSAPFARPLPSSPTAVPGSKSRGVGGRQYEVFELHGEMPAYREPVTVPTGPKARRSLHPLRTMAVVYLLLMTLLAALSLAPVPTWVLLVAASSEPPSPPGSPSVVSSWLTWVPQELAGEHTSANRVRDPGYHGWATRGLESLSFHLRQDDVREPVDERDFNRGCQLCESDYNGCRLRQLGDSRVRQQS
jgi:hypothetical protein